MAKNEVKVTIAGENKADAALRQAGAAIKGLESNVASLQRSFVGVGVGLVVREFAQMVKGAIDSAEAIGKLAQKTGATTEFLSGMAHAANMADVSNDELENGLKFLSRNMAEAASGGGKARDAFQKLGVSVVDAHGKLRPLDAVMTEVADRFAKMQDGPAKAALALDIFGRSGTALIPLLNAGSVGLKAWMDEARALGLEISTNTAASADRLNDSIKVMEGTVRGAALAFAPGLIRAVADVSVAMAGANTQFGSTASVLGDTVGTALRQMIMLVYDLALAFEVAAISWEKWIRTGLETAGAAEAMSVGGAAGPKLPTARDFETLDEQMQILFEARDKFWDRLHGMMTLPTAKPITRTGAAPGFGAGGGAVVDAPTKGTWDVSDLQDLRSMADIFKEMEQSMLGPKLAGAREQIEKMLNLPGPVPLGWPDQLAQLETQIALTFGKLQIETDKVRAAVDRGEIDQVTGQQKIIELHRATGDELAKLLPEYERLAALTGDPALAQGVEALKAETERLRKEVDALGRIAREVFEDNFADALTNLITGTESVADAFRNMARAILSELTRIIAKMLIVWAIQQLLGFVTGGGRGVGFENAISTTPTTFNNPFPGFAAGGDFTAGQAMLVGERGPELVRFRHGGTVIPNDRLQTSAGRGGGVTIQVHAKVDARGSELSAAEVEARVARGVEVSVMAALQANRESQLRGSR